MAQVIDRRELHDLVDQMTPEQIRAAIPLLRSMLPKPTEDEDVLADLGLAPTADKL